MSPQASKNLRALAVLCWVFTVFALAMIPYIYYDQTQRIKITRPVTIKIVEYGQSFRPRGNPFITQLIVTEFTNPFTNQIMTGTLRIISEGEAEKEQRKMALPVGMTTSGTFYPKDDGPFLASNPAHTSSPTDNFPFLGGIAAGTGALGALLWWLGRRSV